MGRPVSTYILATKYTCITSVVCKSSVSLLPIATIRQSEGSNERRYWPVRGSLVTQKNSEEFTESAEQKRVIFHTTNKAYFGTVKNLLAVFGYEVLDSRDTHIAQFEKERLPRIVYMETTFDTLNTIHSLVTAGKIQEKLWR